MLLTQLYILARLLYMCIICSTAYFSVFLVNTITVTVFYAPLESYHAYIFVIWSTFLLQELKPPSKPGSRRGSFNPEAKEDTGAGEVSCESFIFWGAKSSPPTHVSSVNNISMCTSTISKNVKIFYSSCIHPNTFFSAVYLSVVAVIRLF